MSIVRDPWYQSMAMVPHFTSISAEFSLPRIFLRYTRGLQLYKKAIHFQYIHVVQIQIHFETENKSDDQDE